MSSELVDFFGWEQKSWFCGVLEIGGPAAMVLRLPEKRSFFRSARRRSFLLGEKEFEQANEIDTISLRALL